jgi:precorrin-3B synthase
VAVLDQIPIRHRPDRCPGVTRPWLADDGALVRIRLVGGLLQRSALAALASLSEQFGDGDLHLTRRANLQLRAVRHVDGVLPDAFVAGVREAGLLPSVTHELVRNVMLSPLSGRVGGRADLRPVAADLDARLLDDPACAALAGRFLFLLDDGRGDLLGRTSDLAVVALDADTVQVRAGSDQWGPVVPVTEAAAVLLASTRGFLRARGSGPTAPWHVDELDAPLLHGHDRDDRTRVTSPAPAYGPLVQADGRRADHVATADGRLTPAAVADVLASAGEEVVVTPWRSLVLPDLEAP